MARFQAAVTVSLLLPYPCRYRFRRCITAISLSADQRFIFSAGLDGNLFSYALLDLLRGALDGHEEGMGAMSSIPAAKVGGEGALF